jgi:membrane protease subunit (stomatin/prohibitin family)
MGDVFRPGLYTLDTQNIPILTSLKSWKYGFNSPFRCEVYFINTTQYLDMKWGTLNPITMRDQDFGMVRLRAYGIYSIRVLPEHAETFFKDIVGADGYVSAGEIEGHLRGMLVSSFTTALGQAKIPALDLAGNYDGIAKTCKAQMDAEFEGYGVSLTKFLIQNISLPPEVEKAIDTRASMGALGNMQQYTQYQAAQALRESANRPGGGGTAGMAMEMSTGLAMGQMMAASMAGFGQPQQPAAAPAAPAAPAAEDVGTRLKRLKGLHEQGLIDADTFAAKRDAILAEI